MNQSTIKTYTVSELTREIKNLMEAELGSVWLEGEISNLRTPFSGHSYFTLKDKNAQIRAVLFKGARAFIRFVPEDGQSVLARGRITVYELRGDYQIIVDQMEPKGLGALQKAFEQLKEKLSKEGLFNAKHKSPLPFLPRTIGIVTSATGAAIRDILKALGSRFPNVEVLLAPVKVQGEGAAQEIADAIRDLNSHGKADVIIVGRGGGSIEDLWAFNEETTARAVFESRVPIISAVGHEIDFTISDFVADLRAPTPSAAAEMAVPKKTDLTETVGSLKNGLLRAIRAKLDTHRSDLEGLLDRKAFREPATLLEEFRQRIDNATCDLARNMTSVAREKRHGLKSSARSLTLLSPRQAVKSFGERLDHLTAALKNNTARKLLDKRATLEKEARRLDALSPLAILSRGFSIVRDKDNKIVKDSSGVEIDDILNLLLHKGELAVRVARRTPASQTNAWTRKGPKP